MRNIIYSDTSDGLLTQQHMMAFKVSSHNLPFTKSANAAIFIDLSMLAEEEEIVETSGPIIKHLLSPREHTIVFHKNTSTVKIVFDGWILFW